MLIEKIGIHANIPIEDYHQSKGISSSGLALIHNHCPKRYWYEYLSGQAEKKERACEVIGQALHTLVLEPDFFNDRFYVAKEMDRRTKVGKEAYQAMMIEAGSKLLLTKEQYEQVSQMALNVREHPMFKKAFKAGSIEHSLLWKDEETKAYLRSRPDFYCNLFILDLKTSKCAAPDAFARSIINYSYHMQAALACDGLTTLTGEPYESVIQFVVEKEPPYLVANYLITDAAIELGRAQYKRAAQKYQACLEKDEWLGYEEKIVEIQLPVWAYNKEEIDYHVD